MHKYRETVEIGMDERTHPWSATRFDVHERIRDCRETGDGVLATVVGVEGSAYRRPGAKLVVEAGRHVGAITAGCLEGPLLDLARDVQETGVPRVETFDLTDDNKWGIGLGCNGVLDVLLEPIDDSLDHTLSELDSKRPVTVVTVLDDAGDTVNTGNRVTLTKDGSVHSEHKRGGFPEELIEQIQTAASDALDAGHSTLARGTVDGESVQVFIDGLDPVPDLVLFGSQNDIQPVSRLAKRAGFRVVVASGRGARSETSEFPSAHVVESVRAPDLASVIDADAHTSVVLMSHNFIDDRLALESLLADTEVPYIGLMGPRKRFQRMREELADEGTELTRDDLDRISTPIGLDLGGGEPVEIAMSIVSEVLTVTNGRAGGRLSDSEGPIHPRVEQTQ